MLRTDRQKPWVRFHALPNSKRYSDGDAERDEIRRRANILGNEVLGSDTACWLVQCRIEEFQKPFWRPLARRPDVGLRYPDPEGDYHWIASALPSRWHDGVFDDLFSEIADDQTGPTLWMSRANGSIFAPYDGGFDLFPSSKSEAERLKRRHVEWLSSHPEGI
jgi:hypothetical protein